MTKGIDYPEWMTQESLKTLNAGYLLEGETPKEMYERCVNAIITHLSSSGYVEDGLSDRLLDYLWKGWFCLSTPMLSNLGTNKGLPISCYTVHPDDNTHDIYSKITEMGMLTKYGGGVGVAFNDIRPRGSEISSGGHTEGIIPFAHIYDSAIIATNQGNTRRGAASINLPITHGDWEEFIEMRRPKGDTNRQCLNLNHCTVIPDDFMINLFDDSVYSNKWKTLLKTRIETGQSYILFEGNVNKANPKMYRDNNLKVSATNICTEITLYTSPKESFVCCVASLNIAKYDEWKNNKQLIRDGIFFMDTVISIFVDKAKHIKGFENAARFAEKHRALGLGQLGWHTYLQSKNIPFNHFISNGMTRVISEFIYNTAIEASEELAGIFGEPELCVGYNRRNTHVTAIAPTTSNSIISGGVSQGIEPIAANVYTQKSAKGTFIRVNPAFKNLIMAKYPDKHTDELYENISVHSGSVQHLEFLTLEEKEVFLTFAEINQLELVKQAAIRVPFVDQSQSLNLCFPSDVKASWLHKVHYTAWELGIKSLYYLRTDTVLKGDTLKTYSEECNYCEA